MLVLDDGTVITESVAICRYFEDTTPEPATVRRGRRERGKVEMWNRRAEIEIFGTIGNVALHTDEFSRSGWSSFRHSPTPQRQAVPAKWAWLDRELDDGRAFPRRRRISRSPTSPAASRHGWAAFFGTEIPAIAPNVQRWLGRVQARPSWSA